MCPIKIDVAKKKIMKKFTIYKCNIPIIETTFNKNVFSYLFVFVYKYKLVWLNLLIGGWVRPAVRSITPFSAYFLSNLLTFRYHLVLYPWVTYPKILESYYTFEIQVIITFWSWRSWEWAFSNHFSSPKRYNIYNKYINIKRLTNSEW